MLFKLFFHKKIADEDFNIITLENDIKYKVIDKININNIEYLYLENVDNGFDFCIRKVLFEKDKEFISGLENENEFDMVLSQFAEKYKDEYLYLKEILKCDEDNDFFEQISLDDMRNSINLSLKTIDNDTSK